MEQLLPAETSSFPGPLPTQCVFSDEFTPPPQTEKQKQVEARIKELGARLAKHQGVSRRTFFKTAAGMAPAFVAMNDVYGPLFGVSLAGQFIMDVHTHSRTTSRRSTSTATPRWRSATSARSSPRARWPSHACARP